MKRYLERDFLSKMVIYNDKEVSGYLNRPAHIYEEATCKGMWVIVREDRKYKWNYVTRLFKPTLDHKLMQLTASGVANFGNIIIPGLIGADVDKLSRRYNTQVTDRGLLILPTDPRNRDIILSLSSPYTIGKTFRFSGGLSHLKKACSDRLIEIEVEQVKGKIYDITHTGGSFEVLFDE